MKVLKKQIAALAFAIIGVSATAQQMDSKSENLLNSLKNTIGGYEKLAEKKDVQFNYVYDNFEKGKDVSVERYIFDKEHSYGSYSTHQIHVLPKKEGKVVQSLVNNTPSVTLDGKTISDKQAVGTAGFLRKVNIFWFTMMYKLHDPGTVYKHIGTEEMEGIIYDKVSLTYDNGITKKTNDEYILYFNPITHLVDAFFFNIVDFGIKKPILKMTLEYQNIDGVYIATTRKSYAPNKDGVYEIGGVYSSSQIKFNNGFSLEDLK